MIIPRHLFITVFYVSSLNSDIFYFKCFDSFVFYEYQGMTLIVKEALLYVYNLIVIFIIIVDTSLPSTSVKEWISALSRETYSSSRPSPSHRSVYMYMYVYVYIYTTIYSLIQMYIHIYACNHIHEFRYILFDTLLLFLLQLFYCYAFPQKNVFQLDLISIAMIVTGTHYISRSFMSF
jgi:hypothetical protein